MTSADRFRDLHASGCFVMPNPFDVGSARLLEALGFPALATTSFGFAATLGRDDMQVTRDELVAHVAAICANVTVPVNVDSERCFAETPDGIAETVHLLADAGAAGFSIEDWNPATNSIDAVDVATERVRAAAVAAAERGLVLTARCENHLHGVDDLADTVARLRGYIAAGAEVVYAPLLWTAEQLGPVVALGAPVNVLLLPGGPTRREAGREGCAPRVGGRLAGQHRPGGHGGRRRAPAGPRHAGVAGTDARRVAEAPGLHHRLTCPRTVSAGQLEHRHGAGVAVHLHQRAVRDAPRRAGRPTPRTGCRARG